MPPSMHLPDLRWGYAPLPEAAPGYDPAGDASQLVLAGTASPALEPVPGTQVLESLGDGHRFVVRLPDDWNGRLVVCGTPAMRSEFANDLTFGEFLLARGYAFASGNKGIPYNAILEPAAATPDRGVAYPIPFDVQDLRERDAVVRFGALHPRRIPVDGWQTDLAALARASTDCVRTIAGKLPAKTYAVGLSVGGGQVRWLLEREPELVDGGLEWAAVYWSPERNILSYLPAFLRLMPGYVRSGYRDRDVHAAIVAAGFPPDRVQDRRGHRSLWDDHYANIPPFYADLTTFVFALLLDPQVDASFGLPPLVPNPLDRSASAAPTNARGLALPSARAAYVPSAAAKAAIARFGHTGAIERPLIGVAGSADVFVTPQHNAYPYLDSVLGARRGEQYWQYVVSGGTHTDSYAAFGYGLQPQLPFVWAAFEMLVAIVEDGARPPGAGTSRLVSVPEEIR